MEREDVRYSCGRKSKTGRINKKRVALAATTVTTIGIISVASIFNKINSEKYEYNKDYQTYAQQVEDIMDVDIEEDLEAELNKLQDIRILINDYETNEGLIDRAEVYKKIIENKDVIEKVSKNVVKMNLAEKYGGDASDIVIKFDNNDGTWFAVSETFGTKTIPFDVSLFVNSIAEFQGYDSESLEKEKDPEKFIELCKDIIKDTGEFVGDMSPKCK